MYYIQYLQLPLSMNRNTYAWNLLRSILIPLKFKRNIDTESHRVEIMKLWSTLHFWSNPQWCQSTGKCFPSAVACCVFVIATTLENSTQWNTMRQVTPGWGRMPNCTVLITGNFSVWFTDLFCCFLCWTLSEWCRRVFNTVTYLL